MCDIKFISYMILVMTNIDIVWENTSNQILKSDSQLKKSFFEEEQQFKQSYPTLTTENWRKLQEFFVERREILKRKISYMSQEIALTNQIKKLRYNLANIQKIQTHSTHEKKINDEKILNITSQINAIVEDISIIREEIERKEKEIDKICERIRELRDFVAKEQQLLLQQNRISEKENMNKRAENLASQL